MFKSGQKEALCNMGHLEHSSTWPPLGWREFAGIDKPFCQALAKDPARGKIFGLQYKIETIPLFKNEQKYLRHDVLIDGWEYSILNDSIEYPVLSFTLHDHFDENLPKESYITDIRSYSSSIPHTKKSANRAISAGLFLMKQIDAGFVPDVNRVLRVYKLHPNQAFLYASKKPVSPDLRRAFYQGNGIAACSKNA